MSWLRAVSGQYLTADGRVQSLVSPCGRTVGIGRGFSQSTSVFLCHNYSTGAAYSFVQPSATLTVLTVDSVFKIRTFADDDKDESVV